MEQEKAVACTALFCWGRAGQGEACPTNNGLGDKFE